MHRQPHAATQPTAIQSPGKLGTEKKDTWHRFHTPATKNLGLENGCEMLPRRHPTVAWPDSSRVFACMSSPTSGNVASSAMATHSTRQTCGRKTAESCSAHHHHHHNNNNNNNNNNSKHKIRSHAKNIVPILKTSFLSQNKKNDQNTKIGEPRSIHEGCQ